jgi:hypothetical protein
VTLHDDIRAGGCSTHLDRFLAVDCVIGGHVGSAGIRTCVVEEPEELVTPNRIAGPMRCQMRQWLRASAIADTSASLRPGEDSSPRCSSISGTSSQRAATESGSKSSTEFSGIAAQACGPNVVDHRPARRSWSETVPSPAL